MISSQLKSSNLHIEPSSARALPFWMTHQISIRPDQGTDLPVLNLGVHTLGHASHILQES